MLHFKASKLAVFAAVCAASASSPAFAATDLGGLPGSTSSVAQAINNAGQVVGVSAVGGVGYAVEWSNGSIINLGGLPGSTSSSAGGINDAGQVVGSSRVGGVTYPVEWSNGAISNLGGLPGSTNSVAQAINDAGQVVGYSLVGGLYYAVEWSNGSIINLGFLPGDTGSIAEGINDAGQVVGLSFGSETASAVEWNNGAIINLSGLTGDSDNRAQGINDAGQVVGQYGGSAAVWSNGSVTSFPSPPPTGGPGEAFDINDAGVVVGTGDIYGVLLATEWINGALYVFGGSGEVIDREALGINEAGQVVGWADYSDHTNAILWNQNDLIVPTLTLSVPEPSTWALMLLGLAGLAYAGYRRSPPSSFASLRITSL